MAFPGVPKRESRGPVGYPAINLKVRRSQENTEGTEKEKRRFRTENTEGTEEGWKRGRHAALKCGVPRRAQRARRRDENVENMPH